MVSSNLNGDPTAELHFDAAVRCGRPMSELPSFQRDKSSGSTRYCGSPILRTSSAYRGSVRSESNVKSVGRPMSRMERS
jgi:hypothetical protein